MGRLYFAITVSKGSNNVNYVCHKCFNRIYLVLFPPNPTPQIFQGQV